MKTRQAFVANSSSSSFLLVQLGEETILDYGEPCDSESTSMNIDELIQKLQDAKSKGIKRIDFTFGGEYNG